jgi:hypothetical protein
VIFHAYFFPFVNHFFKGTQSPKSEEKDIKQARRRLSVMSDNKLVEGFDSVNLDADEEVFYCVLYSLILTFLIDYCCWINWFHCQLLWRLFEKRLCPI